MTEALLTLIALELLAILLVLHREIAPERPEPYFPHPDHRLPILLSCGHTAEPHVIYPGGISACQDCYARKQPPASA